MEPSSDVSTESIDASVQKSTNRVRKRKKQLYADLRKQMEFYLSDANLRKDRFFGHLMQTNQYISVETFLNCNKIKSLTTNPEVIVKAIRGSDALTVSDCKTKIHRIKPVEDKTPEDVERCTVYVEQLPPKADHDWVKSTFEKYGSVAYISLPKFKSGSIKRFAFVEFDNEESANKVLEEYRKLNVESKILPEELQSIITFKEDGKNKDEGLIVNENIEILKSEKKRKRSSSTDCVKEKKRKREILKISPIIKNEKKNRKKDKYKKNETDNDQKNSSYEKSDSDNHQNILTNDLSIIKSETIISSIDKVEPNNYVVKSVYVNTSKDSSTTENNQNTFLNEESRPINNKSEITISSKSIEKESNTDYNDDSAVKKKRKRNKGKKIKSDTTIATPELRIMSKTEWRKLRNQFLNMQRQKMSLLKVQLRHPRYTTSYSYANMYTNPIKDDPCANEKNVELKKPKTEDLRVKYEPGVILKVSFTNPIESEKIFKTEAKTDSNIKYVDVLSNFEAYIRCDCSESAKKIAEENRWPQTRQLEGEEENLYWEKILRDREIKCSKQKETKKPRGRNKLINRAEKTLAQHIKFVQEDE